MKHGKHYVDAAKLVDSTKAYAPARPSASALLLRAPQLLLPRLLALISLAMTS